MSDQPEANSLEDYTPVTYGEGDDDVLPEDLYYRDLKATIRPADHLDDIENIHETAPQAPPQPRPTRILPSSTHHIESYTVESSDPSDTMYGANTNTYTTDDNDTHVNTSLRNDITKKSINNNTSSTSGGGCGDNCGCDDATTAKNTTTTNTSSSKCGDSCGCDDAKQSSPSKSESCGDDCGCDDKASSKTTGGCGDSCGCDDSKPSSSSSSCSIDTSKKSHDQVQTFSHYATSKQDSIPGDTPQPSTGDDYDHTTTTGATSNIPALGNIYIKTWGCSHNTSDGEYMAGLLLHGGYTITNDENDAHIWILNSCTVKGPSEAHFFNELKRGRDLGKGVIVAGCVPQAHPSHPLLATYSGRAKMSGKQLKKIKRQQILAKQGLLSEPSSTTTSNTTIEQSTTTTLSPTIIASEEDTSLVENDGDNDDTTTSTSTTTTNTTISTDINDEHAPYRGCVSVLGVDNISRVVEVVESTLRGHSMSLLANATRHRPGTDLALPKVRKNPFVEIISISSGCLNNCTYCKTKQSRGNLRSYPIDEIVTRVVDALSEGVVEIWLTSEDVGAYGYDIGVRLPDLVNAVLDVMTPSSMLRMGMSNPPYFKDILDQMYTIFAHPRCYNFLHIPVQAGSDNVLNDMKREYTRYDFELICDALIKNVPGITLATDFICGFPTETDDDWKHSVQLAEKYHFPVLFINQFYPRPGTPAMAMPQLKSDILKARSKELVTLFNSYNTRSGQEGQIYDVLVTEISRDGQYMVAHNKSYDQVLIPCHPKIMGKIVTVRIIEAHKHYLISELVDDTVAKANEKPTILPLHYQHWTYAEYIDSNIDNFIKPVITSTFANANNPTTVNKPTVEHRRPVLQGQKQSTTRAIDDDEDMGGFIQPTTTTTPSSTKKLITGSDTEKIPDNSNHNKESTIDATTTTTTTITNNTVELVSLDKNKSNFAIGLLHGMKNLEQFKNATDEEVMKYAEKAVKGDIASDYIEPHDLDPKKQVVIGIIMIILSILLYRQL